MKRTNEKKKLNDFFGVLSKETAIELEKAIKENRKKHAKQRELRIKKIQEAILKQ